MTCNNFVGIFFIFIFSSYYAVDAFLEPAITENTAVFVPSSSKELPSAYFMVHRSAYANTSVQISVGCDHETADFEYDVSFIVRSSPCDREFLLLTNFTGEERTQYLRSYFTRPETAIGADYKKTFIARRESPFNAKCHAMAPVPGPDLVFREVNVWIPSNTKKRRRQSDVTKSNLNATASILKNEKFHPVIVVPADSIYMIIVQLIAKKNLPVDKGPVNVTVRIEWKSSYGYLSAIDWPLLPFYGVMCGVYAIFGSAWLIMSACQWRDLLRVQYWIGAVILLGMLEKAVFYIEFQTMNTHGTSVIGVIQFAEIMSCLKKTLARMLVIIVSIGFGVVKPRLGTTLHKVVGVGFIYFILCSIEAVVRASKVQHDSQKQKQLVALPLTLVDVAICWWIFTSLVNTMRALRLRRNEVKLSLYRHFLNTLIFAVLASVAYMLWSLIKHTFTTCLKDWTELWIDQAFWHVLFSVILLVIMILWRPTNNNQRYAFSPLLDNAEDDEDDEDTVFSNAFTSTEAMKLRSGIGQNTKAENRRGRDKERDTSFDDELKWVDEHIPSTLADKALPALIDSDEELQKTKFEISKMQ